MDRIFPIRKLVTSYKAIVSLVFGVCLLFGPGLISVWADDDNGEDRKKSSRHGLATPRNEFYEERCGNCHLAYPPILLPAGSWVKIIEGQMDHHGKDIGLDPTEQRDLIKYLKANAADVSSAELAHKIMRSLGSQLPLRVTEVPHITQKHEDDDVPRGAFHRKAVGSFANCGACHPGAGKGDFEDDSVRIPTE